MIWVLLGLAWWATGSASMIYWWTSEFDLEGRDLVFHLITGALLGPVALFVGYMVHRPVSYTPRVWMKRRGQ